MLEDKQIHELKENQVLINIDDKDIQPISADLNIDTIVCWEIKENKINGLDSSKEIGEDDIYIKYHSSYMLKPHETVFVKTKEGLKMPDYLAGRIIEKNSIMRLGLQVSGPLYQPTHQTAIYLRVTNLSEYTIELHKGVSIAQITFEKVTAPEIPYTKKSDALFKDEFVFKTPPHTLIQKAIKPEEQFKEQVKSVESKVLTVFTVFMGAFVSSLALIVVDFQGWKQSENMPEVKQLVVLNISLAVSILSILIGVFYFYFKMNNQRKTTGILSRIKSIKLWSKISPMLLRKFRVRDRRASNIYIASRYREHQRNMEVCQKIKSEGFQVVLPEEMNLIESEDPLKQSKIFRRCYAALARCGIVVVIYPFGKSVSAEIGFAFAKNKIVIELIPTGVQDDTECMINPGFHFVVHSVDELIKLLKNINY